MHCKSLEIGKDWFGEKERVIPIWELAGILPFSGNTRNEDCDFSGFPTTKLKYEGILESFYKKILSHEKGKKGFIKREIKKKIYKYDYRVVMDYKLKEFRNRESLVR